MSIEVHLPDGRVLQFPDGTPEEVVKAAARRMMGPAGAEIPTSGPAAAHPGLPTPQEDKRAQMKIAREHGDLGHVDVEDPGLLGVLKAGIKENVLDTAIGLASRFSPAMMGPRLVDKLTGGTAAQPVDDVVSGLRESIHDEHRQTMTDYLAQDPTSHLRQGAALGTDFGTSIAPFLPGLSGGTARVGSAVARLGAKMAPEALPLGSAASQVLARTSGGALEGGVVGFAKADADAPLAEQAKTVGQGMLFGGGLGLLGAAHSVAGQFDRGDLLPSGLPRPQTPPPPTPSVREQILGTYQAERQMAVEQAAQSIPLLVEHADVFLRAREQFPQLPASARPAGIPDTILDELSRVKAQEKASPAIPAGYSAMNDQKLLEAVAKEAQKKVDAKWQPQFAFAGLSGDEALAALADKTQEAVAPPIQAPPARFGSAAERGSIEIGGGRADPPVNVSEQYSYQGQRKSTLMGPSDQMLVAKSLTGKDIGFLWFTKEQDGGFSVRKVETAKDVRGQGVARQLYRKAFEQAGPYRGETALTEDGAAFTSRLRQTDPDIFGGEPLPNPQAGFLKLGGGAKPPAAPPDPMDALMRPADDAPSGTGMDRLKALGARLYTEFIDKEAKPLMMLRKAGLGDAADYLSQLQSRARGAGGSEGIGASVINEGTYLFDRQLNGSRRTGDGLAAVLGGTDSQTLKDLDYYLAARRHLELAARSDAGEKLKIDPEATTIVQAKLADLTQRYGQHATRPGRTAVLDDLARGVRDWSIRAVIDPLVEVGRLSAQDKEFVVNAGEEYAPLFRLIERLGEDPEIAVGSTKVNPIKAITGGLSKDAPTQPPLDSFVQQAQRVTVWAERQRVRNYFAEAVDASPELQEVVKDVTSKNSAGQGNLPKGGTFVSWKDGKRSEYAAPADLISAFERMQPRQIHAVAEIAVVAARMVRAGATATLGFAARNPIRDQQTGAVYGSEFHYRPFIDAFHGFAEMMPKNAKQVGSFYSQWKAQGGAMSNLVAQNRPQLERVLADASGQGGLAGRIKRQWKAEGWFGTIAFPVLAPLEHFAQVTEKATRVGAYRRASIEGASPMKAAQFSRDVTLDFGRSGSFGQTWNAVEAFANAELQDAARFAKSFRTQKGAVTSTVKALAYLSLPAAANYYRWKDDPDYNGLPEFEKTSFYHLAKREDKTFIRLPRPLGLLNLVYSYGVEKFLQALDGKHPDAGAEFRDALFSQTPAHFASLDAIPSIMQPAVEAAMNYSQYKNAPIVPAGLQGMLSEDQSLDSTTGVAQGIGGMMGISPLKIDYLIRGYGATWGQTAAGAPGMVRRAIGALNGEQPDLPIRAADIPGTGAFISPSAIGFGSDPVTKLYQLSTEAAQASRSMKAALEGGDGKRYQQIAKEHPEALLSSTLIDARKQLSDLRDMRNQIRRTKGMDPQERLDALMQIDQAATQLSAAYMHGAADYLRGERP